MDLAALASEVVKVLSPYATKLAEPGIRKAGEAGWQKLGELYTTVKTKLVGDPTSQQALATFEANPEDPNHRTAVESALVSALAADTPFSESVRAQISDLQPAGAPIRQSVHVSKGGRSGDITQIGSAGDVTIGSA